MDFNLNEVQLMIQDGARRFFQNSLDSTKIRAIEESEDGFSIEYWRQLTELGWTALAIPEASGGGGCGILDLCLLAEEIGRSAASMPLAETAGFVATVLQTIDQSPLAHNLLRDIANSGTVFTPALAEPVSRDESSMPTCEFEETASGGIVSGTKILVPFAALAKGFLTSTISNDGEIVILIIDRDAEGIFLKRHKVTGGAPLYSVQINKVEVSAESILARGHKAKKAISAGLDVATMLSIAQVIGNCEEIIRITSEYAAYREQFGRKIGQFQAVSHPIANMRVHTDACRLLNAEAAWTYDQCEDATLEIAETKVFTNEIVVDIVHSAHALHGAIGYTMEYDLQLFTRRARAFCLSYGDTERQTERAASAFGL